MKFHQILNTNKRSSFLKKKQIEIVKLKSITEMKILLEGPNSRLEQAEEKRNTFT